MRRTAMRARRVVPALSSSRLAPEPRTRLRASRRPTWTPCRSSSSPARCRVASSAPTRSRNPTSWASRCPIVKHSFLLQSAEELTTTFREAFHIASTGRPGPVLIDVPSDIQSEQIVFNYPDEVNLPSYRPTYKGNAKQIKQAVGVIERASKPILYVGGGADRIRCHRRAREAFDHDADSRGDDSHGQRCLPGVAPDELGSCRHARFEVREPSYDRVRPDHRGWRTLLRPCDGQAFRIRTACEGHPHRHRPGRDRQDSRGAGAHRRRSEGCRRGHRRHDREGSLHAAHRGVERADRGMARALPVLRRADHREP